MQPHQDARPRLGCIEHHTQTFPHTCSIESFLLICDTLLPLAEHPCAHHHTDCLPPHQRIASVWRIALHLLCPSGSFSAMLPPMVPVQLRCAHFLRRGAVCTAFTSNPSETNATHFASSAHPTATESLVRCAWPCNAATHFTHCTSCNCATCPSHADNAGSQ